MFPIFIFTGMGSELQNAFLPPCSCFRRKQKQQMPCAAAAFPVKKEFQKIRRFSGILIYVSAEYGQSATEAIQNRIC